jgi:hypothetical protein
MSNKGTFSTFVEGVVGKSFVLNANENRSDLDVHVICSSRHYRNLMASLHFEKIFTARISAFLLTAVDVDTWLYKSPVPCLEASAYIFLRELNLEPFLRVFG